jgi:hypothetical protein
MMNIPIERVFRCRFVGPVVRILAELKDGREPPCPFQRVRCSADWLHYLREVSDSRQ